MGFPVPPFISHARRKRTYGVVVCTLAVISTLAISIGCSKSAVNSSSEINIVRNGFLKIRRGSTTVKTYDTATVGNALEGKFKGGTWRQFTSPEGVVVEFDAPVSPATLYQNGFSVWSPFLNKETAATWGRGGEKGSVSLRAATTCIDDRQKRVVAHGRGLIVIDCRLLFQVQFTVSAERKSFDLRYISLATFDTDDQGKVLSYIFS